MASGDGKQRRDSEQIGSKILEASAVEASKIRVQVQAEQMIQGSKEVLRKPLSRMVGASVRNKLEPPWNI